MKNSNGWDAYRRLRAAGLPATTGSVTKGNSDSERWEACRQLIAAAAVPTTKATEVEDPTEKISRKMYSELSPRKKALVDPWRDLGNSWFDSLINSGVLTRDTTRKEREPNIRVSPGRAEREIFAELPWPHKDVVRQWLALGHDLRSAIVNSNVLGTGEPITPLDAHRRALRANDKREASEHEAAHCVAAAALGLDVKSAKISDDGSGECTYVKGSKLETAIVRMAGELWIGRFCAQRFPYGAKGLEGDHRALAAIGDVLILRKAMDHCMSILSQNREIILATAAEILEHGVVVAPWL